jgi:hypothetical protein
MFRHGQRRHRSRSDSDSCSGLPQHPAGESSESRETTIVINRDGDFKLYEVLRPSFTGRNRVQCGVVNARIAIIILDPPSVVDADEIHMATRVHSAMRRGLLVVV